MQTSAYLAAALVFAVPSQAFTSQPDTLLALNSFHTFGLPGVEYGRFFDMAAHKPFISLPEISAAKRDLVHSRPHPLPKASPSAEPFMLDIPPVPPRPFERTFDRLMGRRKTNDYDEMIRSHSERLGLDPRLVKSVIAAESEFTARAKSPAGALGLMQVMPATAGYMGVSGKSLFEPESNIRAGTLYLSYLFERAWKRYHLKGVAYSKAPSWLLQRIVAAYNAGPRFLKQRRLYQQTREYVRKVLLFYRSKVTELKAS